MSRSLITAAGLAVLVVLWMASGVLFPANDHTEGDSGEPPTGKVATDEMATRVTIQRYLAQTISLTQTWQGEVVPVQTVSLRLQTSGTVQARYHEKGDDVTAGEPVLALDPADRLARKKQAEARLEQRRQLLKANQALFRRGLLSDTQIKTDEASLAEAEAELEKVLLDLSYTVVRAPHDGVLSEVTAEPGEALMSGTQVARLIVTSPVRVTFGIPQQLIGQVREGQEVDVVLADGTRLAGQITWIAPQAQAAMRTFEAEADIPVAEPVKLGQSATVKVSLGMEKAHKLSGALLNLAADGGLYVKAVDAQNQVVRYPVELVRADPDGFWVRGLPDQVDLIVIGQGFVSAGDVVKPRREEVPAA